jgi:hypothetical protein
MKSCIQLPETVLQKFKEVHGDRYDYRDSVYAADKKKIKIICHDHGAFEQTPQAHKRGQKCPRCADLGRRTTAAEFVEKARSLHGDRYIYNFRDEERFRKDATVEILCKEHGTFSVRANAHVNIARPTGCSKCARISTAAKHKERGYKTFVERSKQAFGHLYDYSNVEYKGAHIPVEIICQKHGSFWQTPANHYSGHHCSQCAHENRPISLGENAISEWLTEAKLVFQREKIFPDLSNPETGRELRYDFYVPDHSLLIEFDGEHHFEPIRGDVERFEKIQRLDAIKNEYAERNGITLLRISDRSQIARVLENELGNKLSEPKNDLYT